MPLSYAISEADKLVRVYATGSVTSDDLPPMSASLANDSDISAGMRFLVEAADVTPDVSFTDLQEASRLLVALNEKGVSGMAIVADSTHVYALAQVFAVFAPPSTVDVKVFREISEAMTWLDARPGGMLS